MSVHFGSLDVRFVPIKDWPGPRTRVRQRSPFSASWTSTLELLRKELKALRARDVLLQTFHTENQIRQDGLPYANARTPDDPGVILTFESKHGPLSFPCDTYRTWQDNVRAIALAMEALRKVDRYGVTKSDEQYRGWKALPAGDTGPTLSALGAARRVALRSHHEAGRILNDPEIAHAAIRRALAATHPDAGGSAETFHEIQQAKEVLDAHHGGRNA